MQTDLWIIPLFWIFIHRIRRLLAAEFKRPGLVALYGTRNAEMLEFLRLYMNDIIFRANLFFRIFFYTNNRYSFFGESFCKISAGCRGSYNRDVGFFHMQHRFQKYIFFILDLKAFFVNINKKSVGEHTPRPNNSTGYFDNAVKKSLIAVNSISKKATNLAKNPISASSTATVKSGANLRTMGKPFSAVLTICTL